MRAVCVILLAVLPACSYTPAHPLPAHPRFIEAGIDPGDTVEVVTNGGERLQFVVTEIGEDALVGADVRVAFADIEKLALHAWKKPEHPCGAGRPVGCSLPGVVAAIGEEAAGRFHEACVHHDYCYRHGYATYGVDRETCDAEFLEDMQAECGSSAVFDLLSVEGLKNQAECRAMGETMYRAVRRYGEKAFLTMTSTDCPYDEPF